MERKVRVRFAPSPTGPLHMGGVRTALFNYLFARKHKGDFLLRIEDTDQNRYVPGAEEYIIESLKWCGLTPDEGPGFGGSFGPYRQSERKSLYCGYAMQLLESGHAYYAFDTPDELNSLRLEAEASKEVFSYDTHTRMSLKNSLTLSAGEVKERLESGDPWVIRFKMPENTDVVENDLIRGEVKFNTFQLDDKVLFKADGMPTYHLANVVDDHLMEITHVIRGEEWLSSMPLHVLLYKAFSWEVRPCFAHLPLILKPEGKGKLSKRDGDKMGFPVFPLLWKDPESGENYRGYREDGYFPEAFVNILALLGWNPGTEQELFSIDELIDSFSFDRVVKSGARFDPEKAKWFNHQYLIRQTDETLGALLRDQIENKEDGRVDRIAGLIKDRCSFVSELFENGKYFFCAPTEYDDSMIKKKWKEDTSAKLSDINIFLSTLEKWDSEDIKEKFSDFMNEKQWNFGQVMVPIRLALVGSSQGIDLFLIMELLGQQETTSRIKRLLNNVPKQI